MRFAIACLPTTCVLSSDGSHAEDNAARIATRLAHVKTRDPRVQVAVLPRHCLTAGEGSAGAAVRASGAVAVLSEAADRLRLYIAAADEFGVGERSFIVAPGGEVVLEQTPLADQSGPASVAMLSTPIGEFACLAGEDPLHPEYVRLAVFQGAEYLLNPASDRADHRADARHRSRGARAWENHLVVASASLAGILDERAGLPAAFDGVGNAELWGFGGELLGRSETAVLTAVVDTTSLRRRRTEPWVNYPAQLRTGLYAGIYERAPRGWATPPATAASAAPAATSGTTTATATSESHAAAAAAADGPVYEVVMMQAHQVFVTDLETRDATIADNLTRALSLARHFCQRPSTRLVVFPEFFLQGAGAEQPLAWWERAGIRLDGPEIAALAAFARECNVYVSGAVLEYDPNWPRRFFNTAVILSPRGELILRYRKLQCADLNGMMNVTTPGNIFSAYVERYGYEALIPFVDTEIGRLGAAICFDSNWPELWRAMALQGVELVCNPTSEIHSERREPWYRAKRAHAAENLLYVASANCGSEQFHAAGPITGMNRGHSALIDFNGNLVACADGPGVVPLVGRVDLGALRRARAEVQDNPLAQFRPEAVARAYREFPGFPLDCFSERPMERAAEGPVLVRRQIDRLTAAGVFKAA